ncbi:MAG TPA: HlyD family efflux transporter periplasmic adaptor subunit [Burkholderiaceae bacterium]|nr:HlyD family efflux transporter periplasmic adaptor subunit [Burkholderiaceae bacterium]
MILRRLGWGAVLVAALAALGWWGWQSWGGRSAPPQYRTLAVDRGPLVATVAASGTLAPTVLVQVGSQVSGQLREVLADFNDEVRAGQVIARLDPESFEYRVRQAQSDVEAARAQVGVQQATVVARRAEEARAQVNLAEAVRDLERKRSLVEKNFIAPAERERADALVRTTQQELASARAQVALAEAQVRSAEAIVRQRDAQLASSRVDLDRTVIRAPVDGVVIKRSVQPGQTVAASLQAPELFVIAQNLRDMQVEVSVDEAEVSRVQVGQRATFTVDAFPGRTFAGKVEQIRKAATNVQNVITYVAIVSANNDTLALLPGMTANVRIETDRRGDVLKVPNAALRFRPVGVTDDGAGRAGTAGAAPAVAGGAWNGAGASAAGSARGAGSGSAAAGGGPGGGQLAAFRERLERELALTESQRGQLDAIFAQSRERFAALRAAPEGERARLAERNRAELRARIADILDDSQKRRYAELLAESWSRTVARGRVWRVGTDGAPVAVELRLGLTDGVATEVIAVAAGELREGDPVIIGTAAGGARAAPARTAPRLPF